MKLANQILKPNLVIQLIVGLLLVFLTGLLATRISPLIIVGLIGFVAGTLLFYQHPSFGLIIIIATLPIYYYAAITVSGLNIRIYNALSICLLVVLILRRKWKFDLLLPVMIYLGVLGLSVINSMDRWLSLKYILFQTFGFILMWVTYNLTNTEKDFEKYLYLLLLVGNIDTILIIINTIAYILHLPTFAPIMFTDVLPIGRANLFLGEPDRTAEYHLILLLICLPLVILTGKWKGKYYLNNRFVWLSFLLNLYIIIIGLFRSAWIGVMVAILAYVLIAMKKRLALFGMRRLIPLVITSIIGVCAVILIFPSFTSALTYRINEAVNMVLDPHLEVQTDFSVNVAFFQRALQRPWFGWGIGYDEIAINPAEVFIYHLATVSEGFNRFIRMFFGAGIVGLAGFFIWQIAYIRRLLNGKGLFAYRMAVLLPVIGLFWGHDLIRMVGILPSIFLIMGLGLSFKKISAEPQPAEQITPTNTIEPSEI